MKLFELLQSQITELTDIEPEDITLDTPLDDIHLVSLDFVSIQVALKREMGIQLNFDKFQRNETTTIGDFVNYVRELTK
ncbi:phosphopantetheine-binding protein [Photorhabdus temperata]|uniref:acyl carrier protein n=1 Tax=Photorhabdus temperata TaxID=574560 RepID=UPI0021D4F853|nr:phosphopantetheine-binding protein [Photorhabdus temperata]MCT8347771.1 phosphopantetheine-binding protein [Photorhabdus temperata]